MNQDFITELVDFLEDLGLGTVGTNLFIGVMPTDIENAVFLVAGAGGSPNLYVDTLYYGVEVWARHNNYDSGRLALQKIVNQLHRRANYDLPDFHIYFSNMLSNIEDMDRDPEAGKLLKVSLNFIYRNKNVVS